MIETRDGSSSATMLYVLCRANGGPYDDEAFMSGWRLGDLSATLARPGISVLVQSIRSVERRQADLIAMARGYSMTVEADTDPGWLGVTFTRIPPAG